MKKEIFGWIALKQNQKLFIQI